MLYLLLMFLGLVFLASGGAGLFIVNTGGEMESIYRILGNITFSTFAAVGVLILIILAAFSSEFE